MITLDFSIQNFISNNEYRGLYDRSIQFTKYKSCEIEVVKYSYNIFELHIDFRVSGYDHAGPEFRIGILGYNLIIAVYDSRHWDSTKNTWETV